MKKLKIRVTMTEELLGTCSNNPDIHAEFIASKAPDASSRDEEIEAIGAAEYAEKQMTVFPRDENGNPFLYDYQLKGFFKDSAQMLKKVPHTHCSTVKAFKKEIDGLLFPAPRKMELHIPDGGNIGRCQRPLRASTPMGERVALSDSETVPAGTYFDCEIVCMTDSIEKLVRECLDYGILRGLGQWRNSGKGRFIWEEIGEPNNGAE